MLRPRIIVSLLMHSSGLVKSTRFSDYKYVGDPLNAVRIFNEKEVDELVFFDIDASKNNSEPNYELISNLASECRMPFCYGGGVRDVDQFDRIVSLGVEKVSISASAISNPNLISEASARVGSQSVVVTLDYRYSRIMKKMEIFTHNGNINTKLELLDFASKAESLGAGEIIFNSIDNDGTASGFDENLAAKALDKVSIPITILGGCSSSDDISDLFSKYGIIGACAGSFFVFKGKYKAVLINYPQNEEKNKILASKK